jgi:hypothetical protein
MRTGLFRDVLLVVAPCAAVLAGLASIDHNQRLVEAGYRVGRLEKDRDALAREVEHRRSRVAGLASPVRLLAESREHALPLDYPIAWNVVEGGAEAARLAADHAPKPKAAPKPAASPKGKTPSKAPSRGGVRTASRTRTATKGGAR